MPDEQTEANAVAQIAAVAAVSLLVAGGIAGFALSGRFQCLLLALVAVIGGGMLAKKWMR